jgi:CRP-like cAMP-binding protein
MTHAYQVLANAAGVDHAGRDDDHGASDVWANCFPSAQTYPAGAELFHQYESLHDVYFLEDGLVKLVHDDRDACQRILELCYPRALIGAPFVLAKRPAPVAAVTVTRCRLRRMPAPTFAGLVASDLRLSLHVHHVQSREVIAQFQRIAELSASSARRRLERFLRQLATTEGLGRTDGRLLLPLKRCELAQLVGVTAEHLSRLFRQLVDEGVIEFRKDWLIVRDLDRLSEVD